MTQIVNPRQRRVIMKKLFVSSSRNASPTRNMITLRVSLLPVCRLNLAGWAGVWKTIKSQQILLPIAMPKRTSQKLGEPISKPKIGSRLGAKRIPSESLVSASS